MQYTRIDSDQSKLLKPARDRGRRVFLIAAMLAAFAVGALIPKIYLFGGKIDIQAEAGRAGEDIAKKVTSYAQAYDISMPESLVPGPALDAKASIMIDAKTGKALFGKSVHEPLPPASIAKLMTIVVAYDQYGMDEMLTVPDDQSVIEAEGNRVVFKAGEKMPAKDFYYGLILLSGNDAAEVLARNYPGGRDAFIRAMNDKAAQLGLKHAHFANPSGLDAEGFKVSVHDMAVIARLIYTNYASLMPILNADIYQIQQTDHNEYHYIAALSPYAYRTAEDGVFGVKNGYTGNAGYTEVIYVKRADREVILVFMGSKNAVLDVRASFAWCDQLCKL